MAVQLSWDLHVHPGPSSVPRWGTGVEVQEAARRAGVRGFVWKSHDSHTARLARELPPGPPFAIGSASLNAWATPASVAEAIEDGARWVWGPTQRDGKVSWDLPLPENWAAMKEVVGAAAVPLVLGTGHMSRTGRKAMAELAFGSPNLRCSITHSLYLSPDEISELHGLGCVFEVDLYTATHPIPGRPKVDATTGVMALRQQGATVYVTTDAGQYDTGDPYVFSAATLAALAATMGADVIDEIAVRNPSLMAAHVRGGQV